MIRGGPQVQVLANRVSLRADRPSKIEEDVDMQLIGELIREQQRE